MLKKLSFSRRTVGVVTLVLLVGMFAGAFYARSGNNTHAANATFASHLVHVNPHYMLTQKPSSDVGNYEFACQDPRVAVRCYGPRQMRGAYNIKPLFANGLDGQGKKIVIIDAFQSPSILHDLHHFDQAFGLRQPALNVIAPFGLTPFNPDDPNQIAWSAEITLDVEWAHVAASSATIVLVLAPSNADADLLNVTKYAVDNNLGDVILQSFGEAESCADPALLAQEHAVFQEATSKGITLIASSGDQGAAQPTCDGSSYFLSASTPASDPLVTAVGGTYLNSVHMQYKGEAAWNDQFGAGGGGFSTIYTRPSYQVGLGHKNARGVPDVAYNADMNGGVLVLWSESKLGPNQFFIFGGTSIGSSQWAGIAAIADQKAGRDLGSLNAKLYTIGRNASLYAACFHDITVGTNTFTGTDNQGHPITINGYNTRIGWDPVTGLGTPDAYNLVLALAG